MTLKMLQNVATDIVIGKMHECVSNAINRVTLWRIIKRNTLDAHFIWVLFELFRFFDLFTIKRILQKIRRILFSMAALVLPDNLMNAINLLRV